MNINKLFYIILLFNIINLETKIAIINVNYPELDAANKYSIWNKNDYAKKNKYDIYHFESLGNLNWSQIIEKHIQQYDWILWCSGNSLISNDFVRLEEIIETVEKNRNDEKSEIKYDLIFDQNNISTPIAFSTFLIRNSKSIINFLNQITIEYLKGFTERQLISYYLKEDKIFKLNLKSSSKFEQLLTCCLDKKQIRDLHIKILAKKFPNYFKQIDYNEIQKITGLPVQELDKLDAILIKENLQQEPGWHDSYYDILPSLINKLNLKNGVEVGVAFGGHSERILQETNIKKLYSIDAYCNLSEYKDPLNFQNASFEILYRVVQRRLSPFENRIKLIRSVSLEAAKLFNEEELDFVFIDANHAYKNVKEDLNAWYSKVKKNGLFAGDDYINEIFPGVVNAVNEFCQEKGLQLNNHKDNSRIWFVIKP